MHPRAKRRLFFFSEDITDSIDVKKPCFKVADFDDEDSNNSCTTTTSSPRDTTTLVLLCSTPLTTVDHKLKIDSGVVQLISRHASIEVVCSMMRVSRSWYRWIAGDNVGWSKRLAEIRKRTNVVIPTMFSAPRLECLRLTMHGTRSPEARNLMPIIRAKDKRMLLLILSCYFGYTVCLAGSGIVPPEMETFYALHVRGTKKKSDVYLCFQTRGLMKRTLGEGVSWTHVSYSELIAPFKHAYC